MIVEEITRTTVGRAEVVLQKEQRGITTEYAVRLVRTRLEDEPYDVIVSNVGGLGLRQAQAVLSLAQTCLTFTVEDESVQAQDAVSRGVWSEA